MTADLSALIARLEAAEVGGRELDGAVWYAIHEPDVEHGCLHVEQTEQGPMEVLTCELGSKYADCVGNYTTSLDAALALVERVLPGCSPGMSQNVHSRDWFAWLGYAEDGEAKLHAQTFGKTPALALCIAVLKAKQGEKT